MSTFTRRTISALAAVALSGAAVAGVAAPAFAETAAPGDPATEQPEVVDTPAEETPAEEAPAEETPAEDAPAEEEAPAEETPAEETPGDDVTETDDQPADDIVFEGPILDLPSEVLVGDTINGVEYQVYGFDLGTEVTVQLKAPGSDDYQTLNTVIIEEGNEELGVGGFTGIIEWVQEDTDVNLEFPLGQYSLRFLGLTNGAESSVDGTFTVVAQATEQPADPAPVEDDKPAAAPAPAAPADRAPQLAETGADSGMAAIALGAGLALVAAGAGLMVVRRRVEA